MKLTFNHSKKRAKELQAKNLHCNKCDKHFDAYYGMPESIMSLGYFYKGDEICNPCRLKVLKGSN